jgi:hypothetical protein
LNLLLEQVESGNSGIPKWTPRVIPVDDGERKPTLEGNSSGWRSSNLLMDSRMAGGEQKNNESESSNALPHVVWTTTELAVCWSS